jgi:hypothetical protein
MQGSLTLLFFVLNYGELLNIYIIITEYSIYYIDYLGKISNHMLLKPLWILDFTIIFQIKML